MFYLWGKRIKYCNWGIYLFEEVEAAHWSVRDMQRVAHECNYLILFLNVMFLHYLHCIAAGRIMLLGAMDNPKRSAQYASHPLIVCHAQRYNLIYDFRNYLEYEPSPSVLPKMKSDRWGGSVFGPWEPRLGSVADAISQRKRQSIWAISKVTAVSKVVYAVAAHIDCSFTSSNIWLRFLPLLK